VKEGDGNFHIKAITRREKYGPKVSEEKEVRAYRGEKDKEIPACGRRSSVRARAV